MNHTLIYKITREQMQRYEIFQSNSNEMRFWRRVPKIGFKDES